MRGWSSRLVLVAAHAAVVAAQVSTNGRGQLVASNFYLQEASTGLYIQYGASGPNGGCCGGSGWSMTPSLSSATPLSTYTGADVYNAGAGYVGIYAPQNNLYIRHCCGAAFGNPWTANNLDFAWRFNLVSGNTYTTSNNLNGLGLQNNNGWVWLYNAVVQWNIVFPAPPPSPPPPPPNFVTSYTFACTTPGAVQTVRLNPGIVGIQALGGQVRSRILLLSINQP